MLLAENDPSAKEYFLRVVEMDPTFAEAWETLGKVDRKSGKKIIFSEISENEGDLKGCLSSYQRAVDISPTDVKYRGDVIQILSKMGK